MDQPGNEVEYLVAVLDAFARDDDRKLKADEARRRNRERLAAENAK